MKGQRFSEFGLLLIVTLLGGCTTDASSTGRDTKLGHGDRVGGQAGVSTHLEKRGVVPDNPGERIGGQAGEEKPLEKGTAVPMDSGERVGGEAGQEPPLGK